MNGSFYFFTKLVKILADGMIDGARCRQRPRRMRFREQAKALPLDGMRDMLKEESDCRTICRVSSPNLRFLLLFKL